MVQYNANSDKSKGKTPEVPPREKIEKVISGEVIVKKRSLGTKIKETFVGEDAKSVLHYVVTEVMLPAARNMIVDSTTRGIERMMYGDSRRPGSSFRDVGRVSYATPVSRGYQDPRLSDPRRSPDTKSAGGSANLILDNRDECEVVLDRMGDVIDMYGYITVMDLHEMLGIRSEHTDNKWGWESVISAKIKQVREGWLLDLPPAIPV